MGLLPLVTTLLVASVRLDITPTKLDGNPLYLISPTQNLTLSLVAESAKSKSTSHLASVAVGETLSLTIRCITPTTLQLATSESSTAVPTTTLCRAANALFINELALFGCISNVYQGSALLMSRLCSNVEHPKSEGHSTDHDETTTESEENESSSRQPVYVAEPLEVNESGSVPLQWRNVYVFTDLNGRFNISNQDVVFSIFDGPHHGTLFLHDLPSSTFTYADLLSRSLVYRHDGSESDKDSIQFQVEFPASYQSFPWLESTTYTLDVKVNPVNDPPELSLERGKDNVQIANKGRRQLTTALLRLSDVDSSPEEVRVLLISSTGVHLLIDNKTVEEFTQRQLINGDVWLVDDGKTVKSELKLVAKDRELRSQVVTLQISSVPVDVRLRHNTGIRLLHHESMVITNRNLSFISSPPSSPLLFTVVDLPDEGVLECGGKGGHFSLCSSFGQISIDEGLVRYRHTGESRPTADSFSFQVQSGDFVSPIHTFRVLFTPMNVKVFNREVFMLNATNYRSISRESLFAWTFPKTITPENMVYHIVEPPKFGILSRKVGDKQRRMGVSSNFTQKDIDDDLVSYKLHTIQYSIVNDYLLFRVLTPSLSSEELRFEIVIVPSPTSIQLTNRTIVVDEGDKTTITNDFLSLTTSDERNFIFVIGSAPSHGEFRISGERSNRTLRAGDNFTTIMIMEGRVHYHHNGDEHRTDRAYLVAESAHRRGTRFPFWLSFSVIMHNDCAPMLHGSKTIYVMEKGERTLRRSLLDWRDDDLDGEQLVFTFNHPSKDAALLSSISPHLPVQRFDQEDLDKGRVMIRHLGLNVVSTLSYTVADGAHSVPGEVTVISASPFANVTRSQVDYCCSETDRQEIPVTKESLTVETNYDVDSEEIVYRTDSQHFFLKENHGRKPVNNFTQKNIDDGLLMYVLHGEKDEVLDVTVGEYATTRAHLVLRARAPGSSLELRRSTPLSLSTRTASLIDDVHLSISDANRSKDEDLLFVVIRPPTVGTIVLDSVSKPLSSNGVPSTMNAVVFSQADVLTGRVQYVHTSSSAGKDSFDFNISSPLTSKGPYTFYIEIFEHHISLSPSQPVIVTAGAASVLSSSHLTVSSSSPDYTIKVERHPRDGWIVKDTWTLDSISNIDAFNSSEISSRRILIVAPRKLPNTTTDSLSLVACLIDGSVCTNPAVVPIHYVKRNVHSPQVVRNEVLRMMNAPSAMITDTHLSSDDSDTPTDQIVYHISTPSAGIVAKITDPATPIYQFTQAQVDESTIAFFRRPNVSGSGGFSFLVSDGVHQVGPEWFSIESKNKHSLILEANSRLITSPRSMTTITIDVLRANIDKARPDEIVYTVTRPPKIGKLLVSGKPSYRFKQSDINRRLVVYSSLNSSIQSEWTVKDGFAFTISVNGTTINENAHRFRIYSSYAALSPDGVSDYISTGPVIVTKGGSVAFNTSHFSLSGLARALNDASLIIEVARNPRFGYIETGDPTRSNITWADYEKGLPLVLRHSGEGGNKDDVIFFVYPELTPTRRMNRLRITVPIRIVPVRDTELMVKAFPPYVNVVSGGTVSLSPIEFSAVHPIVPPQSITYELIQAPRGKLNVRVNGHIKAAFTQEELNRGIVSIWNTASAHAINSDSFVFSIDGNIRALIVRIRPMELSMENHTRIEYPQGRTYVVLNQTHLGAYSTNEKSKINYRIVTPPKNGTFYWVAGEKEVKEFTQSDVDNGRILYAQLNMAAYSDRFEFALGDGTREALRAHSDLLVTSQVDVQPIIVEANTATQITASQLNASRLEGSTPRFIVANKLMYGRLVLNGVHGPGEIPSTTTVKPGESDDERLFFTFADVQRGRLYYHSLDIVVNEVTEAIELEVRADSMQPALVVLYITVLPGDGDASGSFDDEAPLIGGGLMSTTVLTPSSDASPKITHVHIEIPLLILLCVVFLTVFFLVCRFRTSGRKKSTTDPPKKKRSAGREAMDAAAENPMERRPDLLGSTVFATVSRAEEEHHRPTMISFDKALTSSIDNPTPTSDTRKTTSSGIRLQPIPLSAKKRPQPSLDYAAFSNEAPPPMPLFQQVYSDYDKSFDV